MYTYVYLILAICMHHILYMYSHVFVYAYTLYIYRRYNICTNKCKYHNIGSKYIYILYKLIAYIYIYII